MGRQDENFLGILNSLISLEEFLDVFSVWFWTTSKKKFNGETFGNEFYGKKSQIAPGDSKRGGQSVSTVISGSGTAASFGSINGASVCQSYGRRHSGQCYMMTR
ncbi:hypothetical protein IEQ34_021852 [Dendrobium chrysotoxum]|uniref:Uncharacterized protein n=1 Tax=Dendrobium chrysotoxum TaxID=161865 RepID=A0AAV7FX98_DENCH|nr:hypothetical protein IEQ34_021852 [Dendrobium chrysotoxum]